MEGVSVKQEVKSPEQTQAEHERCDQVVNKALKQSKKILIIKICIIYGLFKTNRYIYIARDLGLINFL
jgi:16S rRNA U1498 N3-methylase RsmE